MVGVVLNETGRNGVYVSPFPQAGGQYVITTEGTEPVWGMDGNTLYYRDVRGGIVKVAVHAGPVDFTVSGETTLAIEGYETDSRYAEYTVSPDASHLVMIRSAELDPELIVVLNALSEAR